MGFVNAVWLLLLGVLGAASLIIAKKPNAKELIDKFAPYQGWFGLSSTVWGIWLCISAVLNLNWIGKSLWSTIGWATYLADGVVQLGLGLLLGVGVMKTFVKQPEAVEKLDATVKKLAPYQGTLGLAAIGLAIWCLVVTILL